ncbi:MAG: c-type cytochrome [Acidobacteria bacterium]|nr:c-type cytochrome [Acidobacteriota bacterium]
MNAPFGRWWASALAVALALALATPGAARAQDATAYFKQNCVSCHTIGGGRLTGPDLKDVTARRDHAWLLRYMPNPKALIDAGDPTAVQLFQEARGVLMPSLPGMTPAMVDAIISLIEAESKLEKSQFVGVQISDRPFTPQDIERGRAIMRGDIAQLAGGPPCLSCHTVRGVGALGGGRLGPDLTKVYERLQGRKALSVWLSAPATSTMQSVFRDTPLDADEILPVVAYLEEAARQGGEDSGFGRVTFLLLGLGGAVVLLAGMDGAWRRRFRAVRGPLVEDAGFGRAHARGGDR